MVMENTLVSLKWPVLSSFELQYRHWLAALLFLLLVFAIAAWMVIPAQPLGLYWDDAWYVLMAEWYSDRPRYAELVWSMLHSRQYPPLFPYLLSFTGNILVSPGPALLLNAFFLAAGAGLCLVWLCREGHATGSAVLLAALVVVNPVALNLLPFLLSEHLFILLTTLTLLLSRCNMKSPYLWLLLGTLSALCVATRSSGWMLIPAFLIPMMANREALRAAFFIPGVIAGLLVIVYLRAGLPHSPGYLAIFMTRFDTLGLDIFVTQLRALAGAWLELWGVLPAALLALVFVVPGLILRLKNHCVDAWYCVLSVTLILAWPFPEQYTRLLWVLLPVFLLAIHSTINFVTNPAYQHRLALVLSIFLFAINVPDGAGRSIKRLLTPPSGELTTLSRMPEWTRMASRERAEMTLRVTRQMLEDMKKIKNTVNNRACIYSDWPSIVTMHTQLPSYTPDWRPGEEMKNNHFRCPYYYLVPGTWPKNSQQDFETFAASHGEIFRSLSPDREAIQPVIGIFLALEERPQN